MLLKTKTPIVAICLLFFSFTSCSSGKSCFDAKLKEQYKDVMCTMDCPGVTGCDGKEYCNTCIAAQQGISVK